MQLVAVAGDEQQGVISGRPEDQHVEDAGGQVGHGQRAVPGEQGDGGLGGEQAAGDGEDRQQPQQRAAIDQQQQDDDHRGGRDQQGAIDPGGGVVRVGGVAGRTGDRDTQPARR